MICTSDTQVTETAKAQVRYDKDVMIKMEMNKYFCVLGTECLSEYCNNWFMTFPLGRREENRDHLELRGDATPRIVSCEGIALSIGTPNSSWVLPSTLWGSVACPFSEMLERG
jgi:hypothetical protein